MIQLAFNKVTTFFKHEFSVQRFSTFGSRNVEANVEKFNPAHPEDIYKQSQLFHVRETNELNRANLNLIVQLNLIKLR